MSSRTAWFMEPVPGRAKQVTNKQSKHKTKQEEVGVDKTKNLTYRWPTWVPQFKDSRGYTEKPWREKEKKKIKKTGRKKHGPSGTQHQGLFVSYADLRPKLIQCHWHECINEWINH